MHKLIRYITETRSVFSYYFDILADSFFVCFWSDIAFTVLPFVLIVLTKLCIGEAIGDIWLSSEFSFVVIVLLGISIGNFVAIKVSFQQGDLSYRLDGGQKTLIVALIFASVLLPIAIMSEKLDGIKIFRNHDLLVLANKALAVAAVIFALANAYSRLLGSRMRNGVFPARVSKKVYFRIMNENIDKATSSVAMLNTALAAREHMRLTSNNVNCSPEWDVCTTEEMLHKVELLEKNLTRLKSKLAGDQWPDQSVHALPGSAP